MPSVQIKDVPDDTHRVLKRRAALAHQSLQEYLLTHLIHEASHPTNAELIERMRRGEGGRVGGSITFDQAVAAVEEDRAGR